MTKKFDDLYQKLIRENMMSVDVLGQASAEPYDTSDVRTPKVIGTFTRKGKKRLKNK